MSMVDRLDEALQQMSMEFYPYFYAGKDTDYGVYDEIIEEPDNFADDEPQDYVCSARVHLFVRENRAALKKQLRRQLRAAGFNLGETYEQYESDTGYTHYTVEVSDCTAVDD